jgi:hypothetical protein
LLAVPGRLELPTFGLGNRCSIRLSYGTNSGISFLGTFPGTDFRSLNILVYSIRWRRCTPAPNGIAGCLANIQNAITGGLPDDAGLSALPRLADMFEHGE